jgi:subtilisin family serine protease
VKSKWLIGSFYASFCALAFVACHQSASLSLETPTPSVQGTQVFINALIPCIGNLTTPSAIVAGTPLRVVDYAGEPNRDLTSAASSLVPWCLLTLDASGLPADEAIPLVKNALQKHLYTPPYAISLETSAYGFDPGAPAFDPQCHQLESLRREAATAQPIAASSLRDLLGVRDPRITGRGMTIAVLDGGVATGTAVHPLSRNLLRGATPSDLRDDFDCAETPYFDGHGSVVTGIIRSVAPETGILALKVCDARGRCPASSIAKALLYIRNRSLGMPNVDVINMSFGGQPTHEDTVLKTIIQDMMTSQYETLFVISAGNNVSDAAHYPADYQGMHYSLIPVAAAKRAPDWKLASFNTHATITNSAYAPLAAPATRLEITVQGVNRTVTGTSFAAPSVSALAVLERQSAPSLNRVASHLHWYLQIVALETNGFKLAQFRQP